MSARYHGRCRDCQWRTRLFIRYSSAEDAARAHSDKRGHVTFVVDQYGLRVAGSTVEPR